MNLVTLIVPMFNEQNNIEQCIKILNKQINHKFNVIFVDDGSTDSTLEYLEKNLSQDVKFNYEIISQQNQGAAAARKSGLKIVKTKFVMICDCDDLLSDNLVEEIYSNYDQNSDVDILMPNLSIQLKDGTWENLKLFKDSKELNPLECVKNSLGGWGVHGCFAVRKEVFDQSYAKYKEMNSTEENYINNDEVITRLNFYLSKKIIKIDATYFYKFNPRSTTKKINKNRYLMINNAIIVDELFSNEATFKQALDHEKISVLWGVFLYLFKYGSKLDNVELWKNTLGNVIRSLNYFEMMGGISVKKKIQLTILKFINLF